MALSGLWAVFPAPAAAQCSPSEAEIEEARALFIAGQAAVDSGRWADAVSSFTRAYTLSCVPAALYNRGFALRALGRHVEARDAFDELLAEYPQIDRQLRRDAQRYRDEAEARIARVTVEGLEASRRYVVRFDGSPIRDEGVRPLVIDADAGAHTLTIRADGLEPFVWEGELSDGQRFAVDAELTERVVILPGNGNGNGGGGGRPPEEDDGGGVLSSPWFWVITIAVLAAGGAAAAYFIQDGVQLDPNSDRVYDL